MLCCWQNWGNVLLSEPSWQKHQHHRVFTTKISRLLVLKVWLAPRRSATVFSAMKCCFWCQSQPLWLLLPQHNTCTPPTPPAQRAAHSLAHIPTIHFPWRLSFRPCLSHSPRHSLLSFFSLCACPPPFQSGADRVSAAKLSTRSQCSGSKYLNRNTKDRRAQRANTWHINRNILAWQNSFTLLIEVKLHVNFTFKLRWSKTYKKHVFIAKEKRQH